MKACQIFNFLDFDGDGEISEEEFMIGCLQNEELVQVLSRPNSNEAEEDQTVTENHTSIRIGGVQTFDEEECGEKEEVPIHVDIPEDEKTV